MLIDGQDTLVGHVDDLLISDRIAKTERKITLADGSVFATLDNDGIDTQIAPQSKVKQLIHRLESSLMLVLFSVIFVAVFTFAFFKWGLPAASEKIAHALPHKVNEVIGQQAFDFLDKYLFEDSQLDTATQQAIRQRFKTRLQPLQSSDKDDVVYHLHFRRWVMDDLEIPNALALPSGDIILTDKFVELSQTNDETDAVLLHEMGHVVHRHGLQGVVRGSLTTGIVLMIFGDASGIADLSIGLATALVSSHYSRENESEADDYAFQKMLVAKIDPLAFSRILNRMEQYVESERRGNRDTDNADDEENLETTHNNHDDDVLGYFSSHPSTQARSQQAARYSQCFKQGLTHCELAKP